LAITSKDTHSSKLLELDQIRRMIAINLVLSLLTVIVGASGRFW
jgi:uncharacterized membrane protein